MKLLMECQAIKLRKHIQDNQYFMGEKEGHSIRWTDAEHDFLNQHFEEIARQMRLDFCNNTCHVAECELRDKFNQKG